MTSASQVARQHLALPNIGAGLGRYAESLPLEEKGWMEDGKARKVVYSGSSSSSSSSGGGENM